MGHDEEEKEEKRNRGAVGDHQYEGASKKVKRRLKMVERMQEKSRIGGQSKKYMLV